MQDVPEPRRRPAPVGGARPAGSRRGQMALRMARWLATGIGLLVLAAASIAFALRVTPAQSVSTLGQTIEVGAASPSLSFSGPGVLELFGQSLATKPTFTGPVRPRLVLTRITINRQLKSLLKPASRKADERTLGRQLAGGFTDYFIWEVGFVALGAVILTGASLALRRRSWRRSLLAVAAGLLVAEGINLGGIMVTAYSAPRVLTHVHSLDQLVGTSDPQPTLTSAGRAQPGIQAVVMGDSTASGNGNPLVAHPSAIDEACQRSSEAYANDIARANDWKVENLACSNATVGAGILGPERIGHETVPPQLAEAKRAVNARAVFLSVGADDLRWAVQVTLCAISDSCSSEATTAYFQRKLAQFTTAYHKLLPRLASLPGHPEVVVNLSYVPFDPAENCLGRVGLSARRQSLLSDRLGVLNAVLEKGARAYGFKVVKPDFAGHTMCSAEPYVQGIFSPAPFHPTAAGQLAIALVDEGALGLRSHPNS